MQKAESKIQLMVPPELQGRQIESLIINLEVTFKDEKKTVIHKEAEVKPRKENPKLRSVLKDTRTVSAVRFFLRLYGYKNEKNLEITAREWINNHPEESCKLHELIRTSRGNKTQGIAAPMYSAMLAAILLKMDYKKLHRFAEILDSGHGSYGETAAVILREDIVNKRIVEGRRAKGQESYVACYATEKALSDFFEEREKVQKTYCECQEPVFTDAIELRRMVK